MVAVDPSPRDPSFIVVHRKGVFALSEDATGVDLDKLDFTFADLHFGLPAPREQVDVAQILLRDKPSSGVCAFCKSESVAKVVGPGGRTYQACGFHAKKAGDRIEPLRAKPRRAPNDFCSCGSGKKLSLIHI
jgi:hypothetical protein